MRTFKVTTNYHHRPVVEAYELTPEERKEFDYLGWDAIERGNESRSFVRYKGELIDLGDVLRAEGAIAQLGWDGFNSDTFWSGIAIRYVDNNEAVVVARIVVEED